MTEKALIIFARNPVLGKVKKRLAKDIGDEKSLEVYNFLLNRIFTETKNLVCEKYLFLSDRKDKNLFDITFSQWIQSGNDIGEKMLEAFKHVFEKGLKKVVLVGTDIPDLNEQILNEAFEKLSVFDIVLGPAKDGGYYLIGMKERNDNLFENIEWSNGKVLSNTIQKIKNERMSYYLLKELNDIDSVEDLIWIV